MAKAKKIVEEKVSDNKRRIKIAVCLVGLLVLCGVLYFSALKRTKPVQEKLVGGCVTSKDYVNVNILLQSLSTYDNLDIILNKTRFEEGKIYYPEIGEEQNNLPRTMEPDLALLKAFFNKIHIYRAIEFEGCKTILFNAKSAYAGMK